MSANPAMVINFSRERAARMRRAGDAKPRISIEDSMRRIAKCCPWLESHGINIEGFGFSTLSTPVVIVTAQPEVWELFAGRAQSKGHYLEGALCYEAWEGFDEFNHVDVRWEEVSACA